MAISYVLTLSDDDLSKIEEVGALMGESHAPDDIRALRRARQDIIDGKAPSIFQQAEEQAELSENEDPQGEAEETPEQDLTEETVEELDVPETEDAPKKL